MWCRLSRDVALAGHLLDQDSPRCHVTLPEAELNLVISIDNLIVLNCHLPIHLEHIPSDLLT